MNNVQSSELLKRYLYEGNIQAAKKLVKEMEKKLESVVDHQEKLMYLSSLVKFYKKIKNYDQAGHYSRKAIRLAKHASVDHIKLVIDTFLDYAKLEQKYGQLATARIELANLLALLDKKDYQDSFAYGLIFSQLGKIALDEENYQSALQQLQKGLDYFQKKLPNTHPIILNVIQTLTDVYIKVENFDAAIELNENLLETYKNKNNLLEVARQLLKIGEIYFYVDLKKARKTISDALKQFESLGEKYPLDLTKANFMLAELEENLGNFPRSIRYYKRALKLLKETENSDAFMIVFAYSKIGTISMKINELEQAKYYLESGLSFTKNYPKIRLQFLYTLGKIYSNENQYDKANDCFTEFLESLEKSGQTNSLAYGNTLQAIGYNYLQQENLYEASHYYERALVSYEKVPNCKEEKGLTCIRLAHCYENVKEHDIKQVTKLYEKGYMLIERTRNNELLEEALLAMVEFFRRNNNPKKRRIYEDKLVKLQIN